MAKVAFEENPNSGVRLTRQDYGLVDSSYLIAYAVGQFIWGPLGDRLGPKKVVLVGMAISILAAVASGFSTALVAFTVFAVFQGLGQSAGWSTMVKTISAWFGRRGRGHVMGWWCTSYTVGAAIAAPLAAAMMVYFGSEEEPYWQAGFWGPAAIVAAVWVLVVLLHRNRPQDVGLPAVEEEPETPVRSAEVFEHSGRTSWASIRQVMRTPAIWLLALSYFSIKLTRYAFLFWGPKYISESLGSDTATSAITSAALPLGGVLGVLVSGYLSDRLWKTNRMPVAVIFLGLTVAVLFLGQVSMAETVWAMGFYFGAIGFFLYGPDALISGAAAQDLGTQYGAGTAAGFINGVGSVGAILGGYLPGVITTGEDWTLLFYVLVIGLTISAFVLLPISFGPLHGSIRETRVAS